MKNRAIAEMFGRIADALEMKGELPFRVNAYRKASRVIQDLREDIEDIWKEGRLRDIPGIGEGMAQKIEQFLSTGSMDKYEEVVREVSPDLIELLGIQGLGPRTLFMAQQKLNVRNLDDLSRVIENGSLEALPGMGAKKVENIRKGMQLFLASMERISLGVALPVAEEMIERLRKTTGVTRISMAGSLRRYKETVGDIDVLCEGKTGGDIIQKFTTLPGVVRVLASGETKGSVLVEGGTQVDLRVVEPDSFGSALQYFTGSKAHNIRLREMAKKRGLKISEYGVFRGTEKVGGRDEEDIYSAVGLPLIPPELREDWGEIEAAMEGRLPELVSSADMRGDFHVHSSYSDGSDSIASIAEKAAAMGYSFVAICDHSKTARYAGGMNKDTLLAQMEEIRSVNSGLKGFRVLAGIEVDIMADGRLDFSDEILGKLDVVVASVHSGFKQRVTERILAAMKNPHVDIIGHPTGRLISRREGYEVDLERVMRGAAETGTALEINAYYDRMDLSDLNCRKAKELGVSLAIGTDAHHLEQLEFAKFGLGVARRGWLEKRDLLNTFTLNQLAKRMAPKSRR
ncbi:MAG: DNA polymerase/3'-5' exonuclease PolX [Candidatus Eiseniibacteriota bacterium]|nr:MAG: DNA polymerase/3'-5' exonuclease PolX [Candidatus Eisenbacteria bacterium]